MVGFLAEIFAYNQCEHNLILASAMVIGESDTVLNTPEKVRNRAKDALRFMRREIDGGDKRWEEARNALNGANGKFKEATVIRNRLLHSYPALSAGADRILFSYDSRSSITSMIIVDSGYVNPECVDVKTIDNMVNRWGDLNKKTQELVLRFRDDLDASGISRSGAALADRKSIYMSRQVH